MSARSRSAAETTPGRATRRVSVANNHRTDDCRDAEGRAKHDSREGGGRAKQDARAEEARAENRSVYGIHEESLPHERSECFG